MCLPLGVNTASCPVCGGRMTRHGKTSAGRQRWRCTACNVTGLNEIDASAKHLGEFLSWLLSGARQADMPGVGRSFRRRCQHLWEVWPFAPVVDEVHEVVFVDGIHLGRKAVVVIAQTREHVVGWYVARTENSRAWEALMSRIAPPELVVTDGGSGFEKARKKIWPDSRVQRCTFHAFSKVKEATTTRPKLPASKELYALGKQLIRVTDLPQAEAWVEDYRGWCERWEAFLAEKTPRDDGGWEYTHERLVRARNSLNRLLARGVLFTFCDPTWGQAMPAMNNQIEGATNAPLRQMLRDHRGMRLTRRIKAIFWWCYMHTEHPLSAAQILKVMPTDTQIEQAWQQASRDHPAAGIIPQWGDAIAWHELHHHSPYRTDWD